MSADRLPPGVAELIAEIATGKLSAPVQETLTRALVAAADGRPITQILATGRRSRRDDALRAMCAERFSDLAPSRAAKVMAAALGRYETTQWPRDRLRGVPIGETHLPFEVLSCGPAPAWRTILAVLQR